MLQYASALQTLISSIKVHLLPPPHPDASKGYKLHLETIVFGRTWEALLI